MGLKENFSLHMVKWYPIFLKSLRFDSLQFPQEFFGFAGNEPPIEYVLRSLRAMNEKKRLDVYGHIALRSMIDPRE